MGDRPPTPGPSPRRPRTRRRWIVIGGVVGVAAVLVLGLWILPLQGPMRSRVAPGRFIGPDLSNASFETDLPFARSVAANVTGGPWALVGAAGEESTAPGRVPLDLSGAYGCPLLPDPYPSRTSFAFAPAYDITGGGLLPTWTFDFLGSDGNGVRVAVTDGSASLLGRLMLGGPGCSPASPAPMEAVGPLDSSSVAIRALSLEGASFLSQYPASSVDYRLAPGLEPGDALRQAEEWNVSYDSCPSDGTSGGLLGNRLTLLFDADAGTLEASRTSTFVCPLGAEAPIPYDLPTALRFNAPILEETASLAYYNVSVASACCGLTLGNVSLELRSAVSGLPENATLVLLDASGTMRCEAAIPGGAPGCHAAVVGGDLLSVELPATGNAPGGLSVRGEWDFEGTVVVPLENATRLSG